MIFFILSLCFVPPIELKGYLLIHSVTVISNITDDFIIVFSVQLFRDNYIFANYHIYTVSGHDYSPPSINHKDFHVFSCLQEKIFCFS